MKQLRTKVTKFIGITTLLLSGSVLQASTLLSYNVTATSTALGYTAGSSYSFTVTIAGNFPNNSNSSLSYSQNYWSEQDIGSGPQLITDIAGSGFTGSFTRPNSTPSSVLIIHSYEISGSDYLKVVAGRFGGPDELGLSINGGTLPVAIISITMTQSSADFVNLFDFPIGGYLPPSEVLNSASGYYLPTGSAVMNIHTVSGSAITFDINQFEIARIPEPASSMLSGTVGFTLLLRRKRQTYQCSAV